MTRSETEKLLPALKHFANGGKLWYYENEQWREQTEILFGKYPRNIIEDKHFEARKANALGEKVECKSIICDSTWRYVSSPSWKNDYAYRPKPKEVYEWQWILLTDGFISDKTLAYHSEYVNGWVKFEPSKRLRKA